MKRTDMSNYLFHGVRKSKKEDSLKEDTHYFPFLDECDMYSEFNILKNIIEEGGLRGSLSYRNRKATVYGGIEVVCFSEMPLFNLLQYVEERNDNSKISEYGIAVLKSEAFAFGARPVIYGLSINPSDFIWADKNKRIISEQLLPLNEQYRYVSLTNKYNWTHEREWRIKVDKNSSYKEKLYIRNSNDVYPCQYVNGINIFNEEYFSKCVIIIKTRDEAEEIFDIVHKQLDRGYCSGGAEFSVDIEYLLLDEAKKLMNKSSEYNSIENLPSTVYFKHEYEKLNTEEKNSIEKIFGECIRNAKIYANEFIENPTHDIDESGAGYKDVAGGVCIETYDSKDKIVRYLLEVDKISGNEDGFYSISNIYKDIPFMQGLCYYEYIAQKQCDFLNKELGIDIFQIYSYWD